MRPSNAWTQLSLLAVEMRGFDRSTVSHSGPCLQYFTSLQAFSLFRSFRLHKRICSPVRKLLAKFS